MFKWGEWLLFGLMGIVATEIMLILPPLMLAIVLLPVACSAGWVARGWYDHYQRAKPTSETRKSNPSPKV